MIALVTCYFQHNYGSQLQALATEMAMEKLGLEYETIRIDGLWHEIRMAKYMYFMSRLLDMQTVKDKMATVRKVIAKNTNPGYRKNLAVRDDLFRRFAQEQFHLSERYCSKAELGAAAGKYEAFVVGSDQLWLPSNIAADYYTLNFVPENVNKVAYATSFGVSSLPGKYAIKAQKFLKRINHVMVRESSGKRLVRELTGMDVPVVADPTMLFTAREWEERILAREGNDNGRRDMGSQGIPETECMKPYMLCYFLGNNPQQRVYAKRIAKERGVKIVQLPNLDEYISGDEGFADYPLYDVNPFGFIKLIRDADLVLTDSFHCTVFSNLFQKEYCTFRRYCDDGSASTNSRLYSLLEALGETFRLTDPSDGGAGIPAANEGCSLGRIEVIRDESLGLLRECLV